MSRELIGSNREVVGSPAYFEKLHNAHFDGTLRCSRGEDFARSMESLAGNRFCHLFKPNLERIARELERDLEQGLRDNDYIRDENADNLRAAIKQLERCGARCYSLERKVDDLAWFIGGDADKILKLQKALNELGVGERLKEDGVFGRKTLESLNLFYFSLARGSFPILVKEDILQSNRTGIKSVPITIKGDSPISGETISSLQDFSKRSNNRGRGTTVFRVDYDNSFGYHINTVKGSDLGLGKKNIDPKKIKYATSKLQKTLLTKSNHKQITEEAFNFLKDFDGKAKTVRMKSGKVLAVLGPALDALELGQAIVLDLTDADRKFGKTTASAVAGIGGSWALGTLGAKSGTAIGAMVGTAIMPGVGTAIGGTLGGIVIGIAGAYGGDALGRHIVDITVTEE